MTSAERQRRFLARIRKQASTPAITPAPKPTAFVAADGIRIIHITMDPVRYGKWLGELKLAPDITAAFVEGLLEGRRKALAGQPITSERDE